MESRCDKKQGIFGSLSRLTVVMQSCNTNNHTFVLMIVRDTSYTHRHSLQHMYCILQKSPMGYYNSHVSR